MSQRDDDEVLNAAHLALLEEYGFEGHAILGTMRVWWPDALFG